MKKIDITGNKYGNLTVVSESEERAEDRSLRWKVVCSVCDGISYKTSSDLKRGRTSCLSICKDNISINSPIKCIFSNYKRNANKRQLDFQLTFSEFKQMILRNCNYCSSPPRSFFKKKRGKVGVHYNGIDRVDSSKGYTVNNTVTCCKFCNLAKNRFSVEEFLEWIEHVKGQSTL